MIVFEIFGRWKWQGIFSRIFCRLHTVELSLVFVVVEEPRADVSVVRIVRYRHYEQTAAPGHVDMAPAHGGS
jgi:hypothetical protein